MRVELLFPGRFIKAVELEEAGGQQTFTILGVQIEGLESVDGGSRDKGIVSFKETKKGWVLNRTNAESCAAMFGRETDGWINKRVTLYAGEFNGDLAIRVKGSPDIDKPVTFEMKLPRKRPIKTTLIPTGKARNEAPKPDRSAMAAAIEARRARYAELTRGDQESDADARKRAVDKLGPVTAANAEAWLAAADALIAEMEGPK